MTIFKIEEKEFFIPNNFLDHDSFEVKSSPKNYNVEWDDNETPANRIKKLLDEKENNVLLIDNNVYDLYFKDINIPNEKLYLINAVEQEKTTSTALSIIEFLGNKNFTKAETLIVVGGGITQDLGGFVGATYKRGINWILFPTTLLSMCDSCIGGKIGINHNKVKNQVALFSSPTKVVINPNFIKTLAYREIQSGLGEILKLMVTGGEQMLSLYEKLVQNGKIKNFKDFKPLILTALKIKKSVVEVDEFESYYRKSMNYGHTFGHAIEVLSGYKIPHGQAVAVGMIIVDKISADLGYLSEDERTRIKKLAIELLDSELVSSLSVEGLEDLLKKDKKTMGNKLTLVVIDKIGDTKFLKVDLNSDIINKTEKILINEFKK